MRQIAQPVAQPLDAEELTEAANVVLDRLALGPDSALLVVSNPELAVIATALITAIERRGGDGRRSEFSATGRDGADPPAAVAAAMRGQEAIALVTVFSLSHTQARVNATADGARIASLPGITADVFKRTIPVDYQHLETVGRTVAARLTAAERCRVTAPSGTDIELALSGREAESDDGDLSGRAAWGNLPAGEAYISPLEAHAEGTIVFDGSLAGWGMLKEPLRLEIEGGRLRSAIGGAAANWLLETLDAGGPNGRTIAELGIGTNPNAHITGVILEDEKAEGTAHFAFGTNTTIGGVNRASVHIDGLVRDPFVELDGKSLLSNKHLVL
jgi:leucyl aminopeptidase (aminopeptidase T)